MEAFMSDPLDQGEIAEIRAAVAQHPKARAIIVFAPSLYWKGEMFQRPQQLARALAHRGALVFYLQPQSWPSVFTEIEPGLILCQAKPQSFQILPQAFVYVLTWNIPVLTSFLAPRVVYDYLDDISTFHGDPRRMERDHRNYLRRADVVLTSARRLFDSAQQVRTDPLLVPNGVEPAHFSRPVSAAPSDLKAVLELGHPILGYHGALARWFDYALVKSIAQRRRDLAIVLLGIDHDNTLQASALLDEPNVFWLGVKPYEDLPDYLAYFDIGCVPFVLNDITHATSPLKLFEYFAARKPVIISPMRESMTIPNVMVAHTQEEWLSKIEQGLSLAQDEKFKEILFQTSLENTWDIRAEKLLLRLEELSAQPTRRAPWYARMRSNNPLLGRGLRLLARVAQEWEVFGAHVLAQKAARKLLRSAKASARRLVSKIYKPAPSPLWQDDYFFQDNSQVVLYANDDAVCLGYQPRRSMAEDAASLRPKVALISTCKNEQDNAEAWLEALAGQTLQPDEVIVVDAGSTDETVSTLQAAAKKYHLPLIILSAPGSNIAAARNLAISKASARVIASLDFGCKPHTDWLEKITYPFAHNPDTQVAGGWYHALDEKGNLSTFPDWPHLEQLSPQEFIPSSRSLAFTKEAWQQVKGYPEWLTLTGEDTYFALELKRSCFHWAFVPEAVVDWKAPLTWPQFWKKVLYWAAGDGEFGYKAWLYHSLYNKLFRWSFLLGIAVVGLLVLIMAVWLRILPAWVLFSILLVTAAVGLIFSWRKRRDFFYIPGMLGLRFVQVKGFLDGARRKQQVSLRRFRQAQGVFFILAGVPIDDTGGGSRPAQIALELLEQGYWVVYINRFPKDEAQRSAVEIAHPNLQLFELEQFRWPDFARQYEGVLASLPKFILTELPIGDFLPLIQAIKDAGGRVIYEMIDDWDSSLGGKWYVREVEHKIIQTSDALIGTAPSLQEKLTTWSGRTAHLLPNAVNSRLFNARRWHARPADLPQAEWTAAYIGALWGDWFDWDLLTALARFYPQASIVAIGDYRGQCSNPPANLTFLGLKPQRALPAYLAHVDVTIIPWKNNPITQATSPLKIYEYLAMHRPVVAPDLPPLRGLPGVWLAHNAEEFIHLLAQARAQNLDTAAVDAFIHENDWPARIHQLMKWTE